MKYLLLCCYHLVECENREEAIALAVRIPTLAVGGTVEVRAVRRD